MRRTHTFDYLVEDENGGRHFRHGSAVTPVLTPAVEDEIARLAAADHDRDEQRVAAEGPAFWEEMQELDRKVARFRRQRKRDIGYETVIYRRRLLRELDVPVEPLVASPRSTPGFNFHTQSETKKSAGASRQARLDRLVDEATGGEANA